MTFMILQKRNGILIIEGKSYLEKIKTFFDTMPKLYHKIEYVNEMTAPGSFELAQATAPLQIGENIRPVPPNIISRLSKRISFNDPGDVSATAAKRISAAPTERIKMMLSRSTLLVTSLKNG